MMRTRLFWLSLGFASASGAIAQFVLKDLWVDRNSLASQVQFPLKRTCIFLTECIQLFVLPFCICLCCWFFSNFWLLLYVQLKEKFNSLETRVSNLESAVSSKPAASQVWLFCFSIFLGYSHIEFIIFIFIFFFYLQ